MTSLGSKQYDVLLSITFKNVSEKRIPANLLLKSPWIATTHKITKVSEAVAIMQQSTICSFDKENDEN